MFYCLSQPGCPCSGGEAHCLQSDLLGIKHHRLQVGNSRQTQTPDWTPWCSLPLCFWSFHSFWRFVCLCWTKLLWEIAFPYSVFLSLSRCHYQSSWSERPKENNSEQRLFKFCLQLFQQKFSAEPRWCIWLFGNKACNMHFSQCDEKGWHGKNQH